MKTPIVVGFVSALALGGAAIAAEIPTGYKVPGCVDYRLEPNTYRVIQVCQESWEDFFRRMAEGESSDPTSDSNSDESAE